MISIPRRLPILTSLFGNKKNIKSNLVIEDEVIPKKNVYEIISQLETEIEVRLSGLELTGIETNKLEAFKKQYNTLKELTNKQIEREKNKDNIELYLKDCNYYRVSLNDFLELVDETLTKYTFLKRLEDFCLDNEDINISIKEVLELKCDYISLNTLFSEEEKNNIEEYLSNIYFEVILKEIEQKDDSYLFKELSLSEKIKVQLVLVNRIRKNYKTIVKEEDIKELSNNTRIEDFKLYLSLIYKYNKMKVLAINDYSKEKVKVK